MEIGVEKGVTSRFLLNHFTTLTLVGVDPWSPVSKDDPIYNWAKRVRRRRRRHGGHTPRLLNHIFRSQEEHSDNYETARKAVQQFATRSKLVVMTSEAAAETMAGEQFDFIYIDGDHTRCREDVERFWPLVRPGGLLAGHDYKNKMCRRGLWDVDKAVQSLQERGLTLIHEKFGNWGFQKPGAPNDDEG
jgi:hypothetical protein